MKLQLVKDWRDWTKWYSIKAGAVGASIIAGIMALNATGVNIPDYWSQIAAFLTITSTAIGRLIDQTDNNVK